MIGLRPHPLSTPTLVGLTSHTLFEIRNNAGVILSRFFTERGIYKVCVNYVPAC